MRIDTVRCPVLGSNVTRVIDFEGAVDRVICPQYDAQGTCRLKRTVGATGPLSRLLQRVEEGIVAEHGVTCSLS